jgi:hypothetical protein
VQRDDDQLAEGLELLMAYEAGDEYVCPQGNETIGYHSGVFEEMPPGYATERWGGARPEEPYVQCPVCLATFPKWGIEQYLAEQK